MNVLSYSGGVQSTALLVMAATGAIHVDAVICVDLGAAESPDTISYIHNVAKPFAQRNLIEFHAVFFDALNDLLSNPKHPKPPFRARNGGFSVRQCTNHWKIRQFRRILRRLMKERGVKCANVFLGISFDELERMRQPDVKYYVHQYPLVDARLTRSDCLRIVSDAGLPAPDKSACWFCPFTGAERFRRLCALHPDLAETARALETTINSARREAGLIELIVTPAPVQEQGQECGGHCMT